MDNLVKNYEKQSTVISLNNYNFKSTDFPDESSKIVLDLVDNETESLLLQYSSLNKIQKCLKDLYGYTVNNIVCEYGMFLCNKQMILEHYILINLEYDCILKLYNGEKITTIVFPARSALLLTKNISFSVVTEKLVHNFNEIIPQNNLIMVLSNNKVNLSKNYNAKPIILDNIEESYLFFPKIQYFAYKFTNKSLCMTPTLEESSLLLEFLQSYIPIKTMEKSIITEINSCIGGYTWRLAENFKYVNAIEYDKENSNALKNNMNGYQNINYNLTGKPKVILYNYPNIYEDFDKNNYPTDLLVLKVTPQSDVSKSDWKHKNVLSFYTFENVPLYKLIILTDLTGFINKKIYHVNNYLKNIKYVY